MAVQPRTDWPTHSSGLQPCPLCTAGAQFESDYLDALCIQLAEHSGDQPSMKVVRGLCAEHTTAFGRVARETGVRINMVLAAHLERLEELAARLSELDCDGWLTAPECALCLARNELVLLWAHRLLPGLAERESQPGGQLADVGGLCSAHFSACWEASADEEERDALHVIQLSAVQRLADAIRAIQEGDELDGGRVQAVVARATAITST